jgi:hypothetical protein
MRRLLGILLNAAMAAALVLCVATIALWVRGRWRIDRHVADATDGVQVVVSSFDAGIAVAWHVAPPARGVTHPIPVGFSSIHVGAAFPGVRR